jgi:hypothetical protein
MLKILFALISGTLIFLSSACTFASTANLARILEPSNSIAGTIAFANGSGGTAWSGQALRTATYYFYDGVGGNCSGTSANVIGGINPAFAPVNGHSYTFDGTYMYSLAQNTTGAATSQHSFSVVFSNVLGAADGITGPNNSGTCPCFNINCTGSECTGTDTRSNVAFSTTHCTVP